ncbi:MAG: RimK/LysX family protein [Rhodospirillaceae bacterium]
MKRVFAILCVLVFGLAAAPDTTRADFPTVGIFEKVVLMPEGLGVAAKVDTGAENSSIDTLKWQIFDRKGAQWVRFTIELDENKRADLERPLHRIATIDRAGSSQERPVVMMKICVGDFAKTVEVNLASRKKLSFRMLVGASFLKGSYVVDVSKKYLTTPDCKGGAQ